MGILDEELGRGGGDGGAGTTTNTPATPPTKAPHGSSRAANLARLSVVGTLHQLHQTLLQMQRTPAPGNARRSMMASPTSSIRSFIVDHAVLDGFPTADRDLLIRVADYFDAQSRVTSPTPSTSHSRLHDAQHWRVAIDTYSHSSRPGAGGGVRGHGDGLAFFRRTTDTHARSTPLLPSVPLVRNAAAGKKPTLRSLAASIDL
jgi:hypothetical protein